MRKIISVMLLSCAASSACHAVYLTNGISPESISIFGEMTGDGVPDVADNYHDGNRCYINYQNIWNPKFQLYLDVICYTNRGKSKAYLKRIENNRVFLQVPGGPYFYIADRVGICSYTGSVFVSSSSDPGGSYYGIQWWRDLNSDGILDNAYNGFGFAMVALGSNALSGTPYPQYLCAPQFVRDTNGYLISLTGALRSGDIDMDGQPEIIEYPSSTTNIYEILSATNWYHAGSLTGRVVWANGDWDGDGLVDIMWSDGEVQLAVIPEPALPSLVIAIVLSFMRMKTVSSVCN